MQLLADMIHLYLIHMLLQKKEQNFAWENKYISKIINTENDSTRVVLSNDKFSDKFHYMHVISLQCKNMLAFVTVTKKSLHMYWPWLNPFRRVLGSTCAVRTLSFRCLFRFLRGCSSRQGRLQFLPGVVVMSSYKNTHHV